MKERDYCPMQNKGPHTLCDCSIPEYPHCRRCSKAWKAAAESLPSATPTSLDVAIEQAKRVGTGMVYRDSERWLHRGILTAFPEEDQSATDWKAVESDLPYPESPQAAAPAEETCPFCGIHSVVDGGDREYCAASWCNYFKMKAPATPSEPTHADTWEDVRQSRPPIDRDPKELYAVLGQSQPTAAEPKGEVELPPLQDCEINLKHEVQFPNMPALPYRVVYNGNSLMSICSDTDKVVVALPPEIPEGRHTYFQSEERESKGMQFMVYAANRHQSLTDSLKQRESELLSALRALREKDQEITRLAEAIVHIAVAAKITNGDLPMTGPQVLLIASDCVSAFEAAERTIADLRAALTEAEAIFDGELGKDWADHYGHMFETFQKCKTEEQR